MGRPTGETGMHSNGGIEVGVLRTHDARRSASGREAGDVDASCSLPRSRS